MYPLSRKRIKKQKNHIIFTQKETSGFLPILRQISSLHKKEYSKMKNGKEVTIKNRCEKEMTRLCIMLLYKWYARKNACTYQT